MQAPNYAQAGYTPGKSILHSSPTNALLDDDF